MNLALFDFDGTITDRDTFTQFILFATPKNKLRFGRLALLPITIKYKLGMAKGHQIRKKILRFAFKGMNENSLRAKGKIYAEQYLPNYLRPKAMQRIQWHKDRGDTVAIVSASLDIYLAPWCKTHGIELICTEVDTKDGIITGFSKQGDCSSQQKRRLVQARYNLIEYDSIYAYGDTPEDNELLTMASDNQQFYRHF